MVSLLPASPSARQPSVDSVRGLFTRGSHHDYAYEKNAKETAAAAGHSAPTYRYDASGNTLAATGSHAIQTRDRISTKSLHAELTATPLYYYGYSYDDPPKGMWPSRDPIQEEGGLNLYSFVENDGLNHLDRLGLWKAEQHKQLTEDSFTSAVGTNDADPDQAEVKRIALAWISNSNLLQDNTGSAFLDLKRHFNRNIDSPRGSTAASTRDAYSTYIAFELNKYHNNLSSENPTLDQCRGAITELGRLSHSWQDYYAHAVLISGDSFTKDLWSAFPAITGSPDAPSGSNGAISPSSWSDVKGSVHEHGPDEVDGLEGDLRMSAAREFVTERFSGLVPAWLTKCKCHAKKLGPLPKSFDQ